MAPQFPKTCSTKFPLTSTSGLLNPISFHLQWQNGSSQALNVRKVVGILTAITGTLTRKVLVAQSLAVHPLNHRSHLIKRVQRPGIVSA